MIAVCMLTHKICFNQLVTMLVKQNLPLNGLMSKAINSKRVYVSYTAVFRLKMLMLLLLVTDWLSAQAHKLL